jgi:hypothetical protein
MHGSPNHQKTPFSSKKEISAGGIRKNKAKGFSGGASGACARMGDSLGISAQFSTLAGVSGCIPEG